MFRPLGPEVTKLSDKVSEEQADSSHFERNNMQAFSVQLGRVHYSSSWRPVGGVEGRYLKTRRQVAGQMGATGFTHSGQPGQRVAAAARRQLCPHKAAGEAIERPQLQDTQRQPGQKQTLGRDGRPHLPFSINQPTIEDSP